MNTVLLVVHIMVAAALVGLVLMQRSEGGVLGTGGGGFMSGRGQANFLTRTTAYLAIAFFATSIALTLLANHKPVGRSILDAPASVPAAPGDPAAPVVPVVPGGAPSPVAPTAPAAPRGGILDKLQPPVPPKQN